MTSTDLENRVNMTQDALGNALDVWKLGPSESLSLDIMGKTVCIV